MKVILKKDVKKLGNEGEIVKVAEGYGRNYLLPKGLAVLATDSNLRQLEHHKQLAKKKEAKEADEAEEIKDIIQDIKITLKAKTGEKGRLFGSITAADIAEEITKVARVELDKRKIELEEPIKSLGDYKVSVKIFPGVIANVNVTVESGE